MRSRVDNLTKAVPLEQAVVISAGSKKLYRTEHGKTRVYDLVDEVSLSPHLFVVTPRSREWTFKLSGHASIK